LFVTDIGDAIILGRLFQVMFELGMVIVSTSNLPPDELYANGHNRERFLPTITAIKQHMQVVPVNGWQDHRQHPGAVQQRYWLREAGQPDPLGAVFERLSAGQQSSAGPVQVGHRLLEPFKASDTVLWSRYLELCEQPFSALDFMGLCDRYKVILLSDVPCLSAEQREGRIARGTEDGVERVEAGDRELPQLSVHDDGVRRFIALIDECYDRKVPLYLSAEVPMDQLYTQGYLQFPFRRTLSRLQEMQKQRFGQFA
jgi:cell division protein ZapE